MIFCYNKKFEPSQSILQDISDVIIDFTTENNLIDYYIHYMNTSSSQKLEHKDDIEKIIFGSIVGETNPMVLQCDLFFVIKNFVNYIIDNGDMGKTGRLKDKEKSNIKMLLANRFCNIKEKEDVILII